MELNGDLLIDAPRERVWHALNDPRVLMNSIPGCEEVQQASPTETHVRVLTKLGPVRARFVGKVFMSEVRPLEGCALSFEGSGGAAGFAKGRSSVDLADEGPGTRVRYTAQATVGGKLGQIGGRLLDASAKQMADRFFLAFAKEVGAAPATPSTSAGGAAASLAAAPSAVAGVDPAATRVSPFTETVPGSALAPAGSAGPAHRATSPPGGGRLPAWPMEVPLPPALAAEGTRILWFVLGAATTAFGFWVAASLLR